MFALKQMIKASNSNLMRNVNGILSPMDKRRVQSNKFKTIHKILYQKKIMLIPEIWVIIASFCSLIDVLNLNAFAGIFLKIIQHNTRFTQKKIVNFIIDFDELFKFLNKKFEALSQVLDFSLKT